MSYGLQLVSEVATEPLTLEQAKLHCRIDNEDENDKFNLLIKGVRKFFEKSTGQNFKGQTWLLTLDHFPNYMGAPMRDIEALWDLTGIRLPHSPLMPRPATFTVTAINYVDTTGASQLLDPTTYLVDLTTVPARIAPAYGKIWPIARYQMGAVQVSFTVAPVVDEDVMAGMLLLLSHWYEHREGVLAGSYSELPLGVSSILMLNWDGAYGGRMN